VVEAHIERRWANESAQGGLDSATTAALSRSTAEVPHEVGDVKCGLPIGAVLVQVVCCKLRS
jgi:hypothetical protein